MVNNISELRCALYISPWKWAVCQAVLFYLAIWPLTPDFPTTGRYSHPPMIFIFFIICPLLGILSLGTLPILWRAIRGLPNVEVWDDRMIVYSIPRRTVARSSIEKILLPQMGLVTTILVTGGKSISLPIGVFKQPKMSWRQLEAALDVRP